TRGHGADPELFEAAQLERFPRAIPMPEVSLPDLEGQKMSLRSLKGQVVLMNFWSTWCPPCLRGGAALEALHQRYKDQGLVVLGINMREAPDLVKTYVAKHHLTFPHLLDADAKVASMFAVPATPTTLLIDREGQVLAGGLGYRNWASPAAHRLVESLLKPPSRSRRLTHVRL